MTKKIIIIILIVLLICEGVIFYIGFNNKYSKSDVEKMCNSRVESKLNEICESKIENGTCEPKCNCNCDYGYTGNLCNYKYLNNGDKFYYYNVSRYNYSPQDIVLQEIGLEIKLDNNNKYINNRLFLEKINLNDDPTKVQYKLTTTGGHRFYKENSSSDKDYRSVYVMLPTDFGKEEILFSKTLLQTSSDDSKKNKFVLTCKNSDLVSLFLVTNNFDYHIEFFSENKIDYVNTTTDDVNKHVYKIVLSEDSFP